MKQTDQTHECFTNITFTNAKRIWPPASCSRPGGTCDASIAPTGRRSRALPRRLFLGRLGELSLAVSFRNVCQMLNLSAENVRAEVFRDISATAFHYWSRRVGVALRQVHLSLRHAHAARTRRTAMATYKLALIGNERLRHVHESAVEIAMPPPRERHVELGPRVGDGFVIGCSPKPAKSSKRPPRKHCQHCPHCLSRARPNEWMTARSLSDRANTKVRIPRNLPGRQSQLMETMLKSMILASGGNVRGSAADRNRVSISRSRSLTLVLLSSSIASG